MAGHANKIAVITGAAGALGREFALALAQRGCDIAIADIKDASEVVSEIRAMGRRVYSEIVDLSDNQQVAQFAANVLTGFGRVDILINNAAYMPVIPLADLDITEFKKFEAINVEAAFILAKRFGNGMVSRGYGRILQIASSTTGTPMPGFSAYVTTKMAGIGLTRALAAEFSSEGVCVNALSPGLTSTPESAKNLPPELFDVVKNILQLIKQTEEPQDLVSAMLYLTSEECGFVTGQVINCDGGVNF
ncbi:MAG TPA: SDR family oxidoreductase [Methylophaga aminisulfidivorans]|uniref:SDR family NAD(P)-dependent oxidoreductase n=1 Tax=Methylophaga aminisulfidivorans TaxID=230105 RepID=UPI001A11131F|nr:SDR family oxidoreductase [Methylophaga aminisulfidivorans]HIM39950.1 SDR family oxidoreductase [Methylophaga aminisulfidivorans]